MARINLLPWREELRNQKKQEFLSVLGLSVVATLGILAMVHIHINGLIDYQNQRNKLLQDEMTQLDVKIADIKTIEEKKNKLLAKIDLIQKLQESRPEIVHLFDEIPKSTPDGVFLTKISQTGTDISFEGKSQSNARVSAFMRAIESSLWLTLPKLNVIQSPEKTTPDELSDFTLHAKQGRDTAGAANGETHESVGN